MGGWNDRVFLRVLSADLKGGMMSHEAEMIVDAIVDDAINFSPNAFKERLEKRISAFESELISQTRNILIEAVKAATV